jgi:hypothetical protein
MIEFVRADDPSAFPVDAQALATWLAALPAGENACS